MGPQKTRRSARTNPRCHRHCTSSSSAGTFWTSSITTCLAVGLAALATGYAQAKIGSAGVGAMAEKPELTGRIILLVAIPETLVILGFAVAAMIIVLLGG